MDRDFSKGTAPSPALGRVGGGSFPRASKAEFHKWGLPHRERLAHSGVSPRPQAQAPWGVSVRGRVLDHRVRQTSLPPLPWQTQTAIPSPKKLLLRGEGVVSGLPWDGDVSKFFSPLSREDPIHI